MANSLTQWPTQPIPFTTGVRTNPIGWGFGTSTLPSPATPSTPHRPPLHHFATTPTAQSSLPFASQVAQTTSNEEARHQWGAQTPHPPVERKKRSRGSDSSSSSSVTRAAKIAQPRTYHPGNSKTRRLETERELHAEDERVDLGILLSKLT
jgi:hypothetical protein